MDPTSLVSSSQSTLSAHVSRDTFRRISPEIWCSIIDHFDPQKDGKDLASCSLACREFVDPSQRVLFNKLTLDSDSDYTLTPILQKLTASPRFAQYIHHIHIDDLRSGQMWYGSDGLATLLELCTAVVKLSTRVFTSSQAAKRSPPETGTLAARNTRLCESALLFRALSPSIRIVDITEQKYTYNIESAIPELLNGFPRLQKLIITQLTGKEKLPSEAYTGPPPEFELQSLVLGACMDVRFLKWLEPGLKSLKHLTIGPDTAFVKHWDETGEDDSSDEGEEFYAEDCDRPLHREPFKKWLEGIGDRVTCLTLQWTTSYTHALDEFVLLVQHTSRVEYLTISGPNLATFQSYHTPNECCLPFLKGWTLELDIYTASDRAADEYDDDKFWKRLQTSLMWSESPFRNTLFTLSLVFVLTYDNAVPANLPRQYRRIYDGIEERLVGLLDQFSSRNLLRVTRCIRTAGVDGQLKREWN